jgi:hypothetical protein
MNIQLTITYIIVLSLVMLIASSFIVRSCKQKATIDRLEQTNEGLAKQFSNYEAKNGILAAKTQVLQYTLSEYTKQYPDGLKELNNLRIKPKRVVQISEVTTKTENYITAKWNDSTGKDSIKEKGFDYTDDWVSVTGTTQNDSVSLLITTVDSLVQVVYWGKRRSPYLWFLATKVGTNHFM